MQRRNFALKKTAKALLKKILSEKDYNVLIMIRELQKRGCLRLSEAPKAFIPLKDYFYRDIEERAAWERITSRIGGEYVESYIDLRPWGLGKVPILLLRDDVGLSKDIYFHHIREPPNIAKMIEFMRKMEIRSVLDVGSNIGYFPLIEEKVGASEIIAVEPVPITFKVLKENLKGCSKCVFLNKAIGTTRSSLKMLIPRAEDGRYMLNATKVISGNEAIERSNRGEVVEVDVTPLNELVSEYKPQMIRMDIEGYEWTILKELDHADTVSLIAFESHPIPDSQLVKATFERLLDLGFSEIMLIPAIVELPRPYEVLNSVFGHRLTLPLAWNTYFYIEPLVSYDWIRRHFNVSTVGDIEEFCKTYKSINDQLKRLIRNQVIRLKLEEIVDRYSYLFLYSFHVYLFKEDRLRDVEAN